MRETLSSSSSSEELDRQTQDNHLTVQKSQIFVANIFPRPKPRLRRSDKLILSAIKALTHRHRLENGSALLERVK